jgi:tRNA A-37 threonylcarbamoyl transferase component Bud32/predicted hydrocarbon binding protein
VHGLIFFYLQKFADAAVGSTSWENIRSTVATSAKKYLPAGVYPDADAVAILTSLSETVGRPLPVVLEQFGTFLAPHLVKVAGTVIDPSWRTLDLIEHTESIIHAMIRTTTPGAAPPVLEAARQSPRELHLVYASGRRLCPLAVGLMRGIAAHYHETIRIEEPSCMLRGDPFCSFVIEQVASDTHDPASPLTETMLFTPSSSGSGEFVRHESFVPAGDAGELPTAIGGHRLLRPIGRGAMGQVFLAEDEALGRNVAIKVMHPSRANDPAARRRFLRESRATAAVEHPHVVTIHQVGEYQGAGAFAGAPFIVMQYLAGDTLRGHHAKLGRLPLREAVRIGREIAEGLAAAHRRGLIHRDIKPDNVILEGSARKVKIIDFGLARDLDDTADARVTQDGAVVGTPAYMSPERIGAREIDARSDLFGLGVILYELLADRLPFQGDSMMTVLAAIARGAPQPLGEVVADVPPAVADLVMRLIAHDPADRPADAETVARALAAIERQLPDLPA